MDHWSISPPELERYPNTSWKAARLSMPCGYAPNGEITAPVTYRVVGLYDDLAEEGRIVRHQKHGIQVFVDPDKLTGDDRGEAIEALKDALAKLED